MSARHYHKEDELPLAVVIWNGQLIVHIDAKMTDRIVDVDYVANVPARRMRDVVLAAIYRGIATCLYTSQPARASSAPHFSGLPPAPALCIQSSLIVVAKL